MYSLLLRPSGRLRRHTNERRPEEIVHVKLSPDEVFDLVMVREADTYVYHILVPDRIFEALEQKGLTEMELASPRS